MRWLKHLTTAQDDERLAAYLVDTGLEGYGFYWLLLEAIGKAMDRTDKCELVYPLVQWARLLKCHHNKVTKYFLKLYFHGLVVINDWPDLTQEIPGYYPGPTPGLLDGYLEVTLPGRGQVTLKYLPSSVRVKAPKLLKYRDEYTKKSGQDSDKDRRKDRDRDSEAEAELDLTKAPHDGGAGDEFLRVRSKDGKEYVLPRSQVETWKTEMPMVDVEVELQKAAAWLRTAPPSQQKTFRGMREYFRRWLIRSTGRPKGGSRRSGARPNQQSEIKAGLSAWAAEDD